MTLYNIKIHILSKQPWRKKYSYKYNSWRVTWWTVQCWSKYSVYFVILLLLMIKPSKMTSTVNTKCNQALKWPQQYFIVCIRELTRYLQKLWSISEYRSMTVFGIITVLLLQYIICLENFVNDYICKNVTLAWNTLSCNVLNMTDKMKETPFSSLVIWSQCYFFLNRHA